MRIIRHAAVALLALAPLGSADAGGEKLAKLLDDALAADTRGETLKAAGIYGDAVALTHAAEDLEAEQTAADAVVKFIDFVGRRIAMNPARKATDPTVATALTEILGKLDASRCGAYVSAPVLARNVLCLATEEGEFGSVAAAAKVVAAHRAKTTSGRAAPVVAKYADGLTSVASGAFEAAAVTLDAAAADAAKGRWFDLAAHAGTEAAAAWVSAAKPDKAVASVTSVAGALEGGGSGWSRVQDWMRYARRRLEKAPEPVRKAMQDAVAKNTNPGGETRRDAGAGGRPTDRGASAVARMLSHLAKGKPFVSVQCTPAGWTVGWMTKKSEPESAPFDPGAQCVDEGGLTLSLCDRSIALRAIDYVGTAGQVNDGRVSPVRAFYLVDEGETWTVASDGEVSISSKK